MTGGFAKGAKIRCRTGIVGANRKRCTRRHAGEQLARFQNRQGTYQPNRIESKIRHDAAISTDPA